MSTFLKKLLKEKPKKRQQFIVSTFVNIFGQEMQEDPAAWRNKFRKMAANPFAFYRGSAALFYADMVGHEDPFINEKTGNVWIQGDLHAANFGTYMNSQGILVFDVNDFDEAYVGSFTWDLKRLIASLSLLGYQKAMSDEEIRQMIQTLAKSYAGQIAEFASNSQSKSFALTLENTKGKLFETLQNARLNTRVGMLDYFTTIENHDRRFKVPKGVKRLEDAQYNKVLVAIEAYFQTIPTRKRFGKAQYNVKDIVVRKGMGIGSAGLPSYSILLEGPTQALENDILIYMKQAQPAAPSRIVNNPRVKAYFKHDGHRTVLSQRALQAYADPWLGYAELDGFGQLVAELQPNTVDLEWEDINRLEDIQLLLGYLGQAVAKIHCVSDEDSDQTVVPYSTDQAIHEVISGKESEFVDFMVTFGENYGTIVRQDHGLFVDAFRNHLFPGL